MRRAVAVLKLERLPRGYAIVDANGKPVLSFQSWWQRTMAAIEGQEASQDAILADLAATQADLAAAQADIVAQLALIVAAQSDATTALRRVAIAGSYTTAGALLTATDAGSDATITIADHTRYYSADTDYPAVAITGAALTGLAYSTQYFVYYDDTTLADTTPTFIATTDGTIAQANYAAGRHPLGPATTPASGGGGTSGGGGSPPGGGGGSNWVP